MRGRLSRSFLLRVEDARPGWYVVDAAGKVLGRLATRVATVLMGKHKPTYTPHVDSGDHVIVLNAQKVRFTGRKLQQRIFMRHAGYLGEEQRIPWARLFAKKPEKVVELAVTRMLPKTVLGKHMARKLNVYRGGAHPHAAQKPEPFPLKV